MHHFNKLKKYSGAGLLLLRLVVGVIFIAHGSLKWATWSIAPSEQLPQIMLYVLRTLSIIEPIAGVAMILGLFVPIGALIFSVIMVGAITLQIVMFKNPFVFPTGAAGWEFELLLLAVALTLLSSGGGLFSLDGKIKIPHKEQTAAAPPVNQPM